MKKKTEAELKETLAKIDALCKELGVEIGGCGCCGGPWLQEVGEQHVGDAVLECINPGKLSA